MVQRGGFSTTDEATLTTTMVVKKGGPLKMKLYEITDKNGIFLDYIKSKISCPAVIA